MAHVARAKGTRSLRHRAYEARPPAGGSRPWGVDHGVVCWLCGALTDPAKRLVPQDMPMLQENPAGLSSIPVRDSLEQKTESQSTRDRLF
jgi:hypothetical protein